MFKDAYTIYSLLHNLSKQYDCPSHVVTWSALKSHTVLIVKGFIYMSVMK